MNILKNNVSKLKEMFPEIVTEDKIEFDNSNKPLKIIFNNHRKNIILNDIEDYYLLVSSFDKRCFH